MWKYIAELFSLVRSPVRTGMRRRRRAGERARARVPSNRLIDDDRFITFSGRDLLRDDAIANTHVTNDGEIGKKIIKISNWLVFAAFVIVVAVVVTADCIRTH